MTPKFRILALAAMSWVAAVSVQAAPTFIDFKFDFEKEARDAGLKREDITLVDDFTLQGATVYNQKYFDNDNDYPSDFPKDTDVSGLGFIQNRHGNGGSDVKEKIEIGIKRGGRFNGRDIDFVSFSLAAGEVAGMTFEVHDAITNKWIEKERFRSSSAFTWVSQSYDIEDGIVDRIRFNIRPKSDITFALDNFSFRLGAPTGGGTVPEPAGLGLVVLALAAAGFSTRRRRV